MKFCHKGKSIIILLICATLFTGCSRIHFTTILVGDKVYKIEDEVCTLPEAEFMLAMEKGSYENSFGNDIWNQKFGDSDFEDYVKSNVKNKMGQLETMSLLAKEKDISLTSAEKAKVAQIAEQYYSGLTKEQIDNLGITQDTIKDIVTKYAISEKVYQELTDDIKVEISDEDAKVIKVQQIFVKTFNLNDKEKEVPYNSDDVEKAKKKAEKVLSAAKAGDDFTALAQEYSDDSQVEYSFCKGETISKFEAAAFVLTDGEVSDLVKTDRGFYIIKCISSYLPDETVTKKAELVKNEKDKAFQEIYDPFANSLTATFNNKLWKKTSITSIEKVDTNLYDVFDESYNQ